MKIAKRVLAVVIAMTMVAALSAMAFAAGPVFKLVGSADGDTATVTLYLVNCEGFESGDVVLTYDKDVLSFTKAGKGKDASAIDDSGNTYSQLANGNEAGIVKFTFNLLENLQATDGVDEKNFAAEVFTFKVIDASAPSTEIKLTIKSQTGVEATAEDCTITLKPEPDKGTTADVTPVIETTTAEDPSGKINPPTGDEPTGDNMALYAAGAVVALAGAAFIISKKRK